MATKTPLSRKKTSTWTFERMVRSARFCSVLVSLELPNEMNHSHAFYLLACLLCSSPCYFYYYSFRKIGTNERVRTERHDSSATSLFHGPQPHGQCAPRNVRRRTVLSRASTTTAIAIAKVATTKSKEESKVVCLFLVYLTATGCQGLNAELLACYKITR